MLEQARALCRRFGVRQLDVFGSVLTERFDPERSDVDLLVSYEDDAAARSFDGYFDLVEALEGLFMRKVDLVEDALVVNPYRRRSIDATRRCIYPAP
jgi:predicted nucleotidyltransferase